MGLMSWFREILNKRRLKFTVTRLKQSPLAIVGMTIIIFYMIIALLAPVIAPAVSRDPFRIWQDEFPIGMARPPGSPILRNFQGPEAIKKGYTMHIFGSIEGLDIYYGCIWGAVVAFRTGILVASGILVLGFIIGAIAGYYGGIIDELIMKFTEIIFAFSFILAILLVLALNRTFTVDVAFLIFMFALPVAIAIIAHYGFKFSGRWSMAGGFLSFSYIFLFLSVFGISIPNLYLWVFRLTGLDKVLIALIIVGSPLFARTVRDEVFRIKHERFAKAAEAIGYSNLGVVVEHIDSGLTYPILLMPFLNIGLFVILAATLSFIGIGSPYGYADWGQLISFSRDKIYAGALDPLKYWYTFTIPGLFIFFFVLGWILLRDAFRDIQERKNLRTPKLLYLHRSDKV